MMKPWHILIFSVGVLGSLYALTYLATDTEDGKSHLVQFKLNGDTLTIKYPSDSVFHSFKPVLIADIDSVSDAAMDEDDMDALIGNMSKPDTAFNKQDTTLNGLQVPPNKDIGLTADGVMPIAFPDGNRAIWSSLFAELSNIQNTRKSIRIVHYGDSQIEGDRITGYVRDKFQKLFGGNGPGFIPLKIKYTQITANITSSENWIRRTVFGPSSQRASHNRYGAYASLTRFTKELPDSLISDTLPQQTAWVELGKSSRTYSTAKAYNVVKVHYGNCRYPVSIKVTNGGEVIVNDSLRSNGGYNVYTIRLGATPDQLRIEFTGYHSPDFYGLTLDGNYGVQMDNVAMRGSGGTIFGKINFTEFDAMLDGLNTEFVIMQYGGNLMPYLKDKKQAETNAKWFQSQIYRIKKARPNVKILVIGPSDMSTMIEEEYQTYPLMEYFIEQWKAAALEAGAAYWDMYRAMGGENSMVAWVEKGWAGEDHTHFSNAGMKAISSLLMKALLLEYQYYQSNPKQKDAVE